MAKSFLVNVNRCVGCWTCSLACKVAYDLPLDDYRVIVRTLGGGGVDTPGGEWPNLHMKWEPVYTNECIKCSGDASTDHEPYCVYNCTTEAITCGDIADPESKISKEMDRLKGMGYKVSQLPSWEPTMKDVYYAEKGI